MTAITTTNGTSSSEEIITEMRADQKEHSTQMKRLETLFAALSSATTTTTATPSTPVPRERLRRKIHSEPTKVARRRGWHTRMQSAWS